MTPCRENGNRRWTWLFMAALAVAAALNWRAPPTAPRFAVVAPSTPAEGAGGPDVLITQPTVSKTSHSASLVALPGNRLVVFWFAGSREGAPDVNILMSRYQDGHWQNPVVVVTPARLTADTGRYVRKVGNPMAYRAVDGRLHLFVVSVSFGGWSGSSLNHLVSSDDGQTWSPARRLITSPFFNLSTLVRTHAVALDDGGFYVPAYHEFARTYPIIMRFAADGKVTETRRLSSRTGTLQPALVATSSQHGFAFLRNKHAGGNMLMQRTLDGGLTWSAPATTSLPNPNSSIAAERLPDGRLLLSYNPISSGRNALDLAASVDGVTWQQLATVEKWAENSEFSYPSMVLHGRRIHLAFTWNRRSIKYWTLPLSDLESRGAPAPR